MGNKSKKTMDKLDPHMRPLDKPDKELKWLSPFDEPFRISGFAWFDMERKFRRLPVLPEGAIPHAVDHMANHTTGGQIRFQTDSTSITVRVKLRGPADMDHMPATGQCGFDCYVDERDTINPKKYVSTTRFNHFHTEYEASFFKNWQKEMSSYCLNMPLYQGVDELWIGLDADAEVIAAPDYISDKKIVIYGTSITQGGCASRPGMLYSNILSRRIPMEFINLGISGNGKGEPEVAEIIAQIENPGLLVLDYEGNCVDTPTFRKTLPEFIRILREAHPEVPLLIPSRIRYGREDITPHLRVMREERKQFEIEVVEQLRAQGDQNIFFFDGSNAIGDDKDYFECMVDGSHPTDLGFIRMADAMENVYKALVMK